MLQMIEQLLANTPWLQLTEFLIDVTLKGSVFCVAAGVATTLLFRSPASTRSLIWVFALIGLLALPVFSLVSPLWNLPLLPDLSSWGTQSYTSEFAKPDPEGIAGAAGGVSTDVSSSRSGLLDSISAGATWSTWAILFWVVGGLVYLSWYLISHAGVGLIVRRAHPAGKEWRTLYDSETDEQNLWRKVRLLESEDIKAAITVGVVRPAIVLPCDSDEWTESKRRLILSHELAHVRRWDTLVEMLALIVTAFYWFNPLVWLAVKQLRIERERDCDNAVLYSGARPSDYAELLIRIAADLEASAKPAWQLSTISQNSNLKDRLMSILNQKINRNRGSRRSVFLTGLLVLALAIPISTSGIWNVQAGEKSKKVDKAKYEEMKKKEEQAIKKKKLSPEEQVKLRMEKICSQENSAACKVGKTMKTKGPEAGIKAFMKMKEAKKGEYVFKEAEFNTLGYAFLYSGAIKEAIAVFKLNVKEYPDSWNVYDSLGEAYLVAEEYEKAEKYYKKALAMNPESESSKKALEKLQALFSKTL
jgi:beta-lactamase regulating signal transducer with metallopeptidase domain